MLEFTAQLLTLVIQASSFIAVFAAITAAVVMFSVTKKFGTGILASGFKVISFGVLLIGLGIVVDALNSYLQISSYTVSTVIIFVKYVLFVAGTYTIVIGSKKTGDKLESLTK